LKHDEAASYYRRALVVDPKNRGIYFNLGIVLAKKGRLKEAEGHFRQAIYLKPDYEEARRALRLALDIQQRQKR
jgi:tetratricopeptide (TPR) repeat protein